MFEFHIIHNPLVGGSSPIRAASKGPENTKVFAEWLLWLKTEFIASKHIVITSHYIIRKIYLLHNNLGGSCMSANSILFTKRLREDQQLEIEERISTVENGLSPVVTIAGSERQFSNILSRMADLGIPGCSISVIESGQISWSKSYGVKQSGSDEPITVHTLFQAGSISKPITALGALMLVEQGKLDLDKPVNDYLKAWRGERKIDWIIPENELAKKTPVTLRMLLSHRAGLTVAGFPGYEAGQSLPSIVQVLKGEPPAKTPPVIIDTEPGTKTRYSGGGTMIVQLLIEQIAATENKTFVLWMKENVLDRLGMEYSTFEQRSAEYTIAYSHRGDSGIVPGGAIMYVESAAAGLWTTTSDLAKAVIAIQESMQGKPSLLSCSMTKEMLKRQYEDGEYGLGPSISNLNGVLAFEHPGSGDGFAAHWYGHVDGSYGFVVMTNAYSGRSLIPEVIIAVQRAYGLPTAPTVEVTLGQKVTENYDAFAGSYRIIDGFNIDVIREGDTLFLQQPGANKHELSQVDPFTFVDIQGKGKLIKFDVAENHITVASVKGDSQYIYAKLNHDAKTTFVCI